MFPDMTTAALPLERLTRLEDGLEHLEGLWGEGVSDAHSESEYTEDGRRVYEVQTEDGQWVAIDADDDDEWVEDGEDVEMADGTGGAESDPEMPPLQPISDPSGLLQSLPITNPGPDAHTPVPGSWPSLEAEASINTPTPSSTPRPEDVAMAAAPGTPEANGATSNNATLSTSWKRFEILPSAPADHAFISNLMGQPSRQFLARLTREYRALETSLPGTSS